MADRMTYLRADGLRGRGWSDGMVRALLGWPDVQGRDPRRRSVAPVRLYLLARVEAVERSPEFARCAQAGPGAAARAAAERRRQAVLAAVRAEPVRVPVLPVPELERRAASHRRVLAGAGPGAAAGPPGAAARGPSGAPRARTRPPGDPVARVGPPGALVRWQVDYLRHALSRYDVLLDGLHGGVGRAEAERLLHRRLLEAVAAAYPHLAAECRRRLR
ncbi:hypothetical protein C6N75_16550 [Streptomyces solincola]|uniref:Uncharacterized protein n=1 Tax=Streptomyces solincola TaxID=2100817 RepID=A0A2S9PUN6_9ACTN|nr:hypothetical protein [Streptomyces solincola]PRH78131.1 hypothetical protein C6N75_16550 [Streptomyces solincola]